jgi:hypothetical protein
LRAQIEARPGLVRGIPSNRKDPDMHNPFINGIDSRLVVGKQLNVFASVDHDKRKYEINPQCWGSDLDLSPFSVWNSVEGNRRAGTLIASDAILLAAHYPLDVGATVAFQRHEFKGDLNNDGIIDFADLVTFARSAKREEPDYFNRLTELARNFNTQRVVTRKIVATSRVQAANMPQLHDDLLIAKLDKPIPVEQIKPVPILSPAADLGHRNWWEVRASLPAVSLNQHRQLLVCEIRRDAISRDGWLDASRPSDSPRRNFYGGLNPGDSGCPVFLVINNQPVLLYCARRGSPQTVDLVSAPPGSGPFAGKYLPDIVRTLWQMGCDVRSLRTTRGPGDLQLRVQVE